MSRFCAICTSERGPFSLQIVDEDRPRVTVCARCSGPAFLEEPAREPMRVVSAVAEYMSTALTPAEWSKKRRDENRALQRCVNHPRTGKAAPHAAPVPGFIRCEACLATHRGSTRRKAGAQ